MGLLGNGEPTQEELMEMQREQERERGDEQTARSLAQTAAQQDQPAKAGYWDILTEPDIESDVPEYEDHLEALQSVEFSGQLAIGNITRSDWRSFTWRVENQTFVTKNEFQDQDSKLDDLDMLAMYGEKKATLTDKMARRLRAAELPRKFMISNSIDARGQRSGTEIHAVARTEAGEEDGDGDDESRISRWLGN